MNNYTTARLPLRQSENSQLLMERILEAPPAPQPAKITARKPRKIKAVKPPTTI